MVADNSSYTVTYPDLKISETGSTLLVCSTDQDFTDDVKTIFEDGTYLLKPKHYPSLRYAEIIKIKFAQNVALDDMLFNTKGMRNAMKQSERICFSDYQLKVPEVEDIKI